MFSFVTKKCFSKLRWVEVKRNLSRGTTLTNSYALSCNKQEDFLENKHNHTKEMLLQQKKYMSTNTAHKDEVQQLMAVYPDIVHDLTVSTDIITLPDVAKWLSEVLKYNVPHGKKYRPLIFMLTYKAMAEPENQTPEGLHLARILAWIVDLTSATLLLHDDLMDGSETRRGFPCWYKKVGLASVRDCYLLDGSVYALLRKYIRDKPYYGSIVQQFQEGFLKVIIAQAMEFAAVPPNKPNLDLFTTELYEILAIYKTSVPKYFPLALAMTMAGKASEIQQTEPIFKDIGILYQLENDFHDCFGNPSVTGKVGTDIQEGKCTWLVINAMQRGSAKQRKLIRECYGYWDSQKVSAVKDLYKELGLPAEYDICKDELLSTIQSNIQNISNEQVRKLLLQIADLMLLKYKLP